MLRFPSLSLRRPQVLLFALLPFVLSACGTYHARSGACAQVRGSFVRKGLTNWDQIEFVGVDGESLSMPMYGQQYYKVDAGRRALYFLYSGNRGYFGRLLKAPLSKVTADLAANHRYDIVAQADIGQAKVWVVDSITKQPICAPVYGPVQLQAVETNYAPVIVPVPMAH